ncbi:uncharacterized protein LOC131693415 [Topomyia yanbarensis]|uniref:uncharacterized protein LOC131693415 n=1 Tax=Topomyia yanbarensis TaxID=2498891 RepID=UPI00273AE45D|nr:uncharacterized protein LOC131693415 [Topomyia yanbarensis]XP_058837185.1 uncharacterized protein LOC131693415 [Topomyia yanbarensis]
MPNTDPNLKTPEQGKSSDCVCCAHPESADDCVQCDRCDGWWHMSCAQVTSSVADRPWTCRHCLPVSVCTPTSSAKAARMKMQRLKEQQELEQRHLAEKHQLEEELEETASNRSRISHRTSQDRVKQWQQQCMEQGASAHGQQMDQPTGGAAASPAMQLCDREPTLGQVVNPSEPGLVTRDQQQYTGAMPKTPKNPQLEFSVLPAVQPPVPPAAPTCGNSFDPHQSGLIVRDQQQYTGAIPKAHRSQRGEFPVPPVVSTLGNLFDPQQSGLTVCDQQQYTGAITQRQQVAGSRGKVQPPVAPTCGNSFNPHQSGLIVRDQQLYTGAIPKAHRSQQGEFLVPPVVTTLGNLFDPQQPGLTVCDQQQYTGAITQRQQVAGSRGKVQPPVPPVAHQGKPLNYPPTSVPLPSNYGCSLQHIMKQFGTLAASATVPSNNMNTVFPSTGSNVGLAPQANPSIHSGLVSATAGPPIVGHTPLANGTVFPNMELSNVGPMPHVNPSLSTGIVPPPPGLPVVEQYTPSPSQLAARQVMSRDLPSFSGNPVDWPIFISSFMNSSLACGYNSAENLSRLQRCLKGHAYESVKSRLLLPESVPQVIDTLRLLYGRPGLLIGALLQKVRSVQAPKAEKLETIIDFGMAVRSLCDHLEAAGQQEHLSNPTLLMELVEKLPVHTKMQWADYIQQHPVVNLKAFGDFMLKVVTAVCSVSNYTGESNSSQQKPRHKGAVNTHSNEAESVREVVSEKDRACICCKKSGHRLAECTAFKAYTVDSRWNFVRDKGLCRSCLNAHGKRSCRNAKLCVIDGCTYRHHALLHSNRSNANQRPTQELSIVQNHTHRQGKQTFLFRIIPVVLRGPRATIETFAFLDDGSDLSLIENSLVEQLGIDGRKTPLCMKWTGNVTRVESESKQVRVFIRGANSNKQFTINDVRTVNELTLPEQNLDYDKLARHYRHLQGLPIASYTKAIPRLLIGVNNANLTVPLQAREGKRTEPIAVKTRLGWCIFGGGESRDTHSLNYHACECAGTGDQELHNAVKDYFSMEDAGVQPPVVLESVEDTRAREIMERTTIRVGEQFQTGLLWRYDEIEFPDSYNMAVKRFECLERRMLRDPELAANLKKQIAEYQLKGYAHRATQKELALADPKRVWYLPLGVVTNPRKPGKVRLIWDAAAKVDGISLNSMLLKGPDQLSSLPGVLLRFRQYKVGVSADIREMFHQLLICEPDRHSQRFLFRSDPSRPVETYIMDVATFGSTCSPASAQYAKNKNAEEFVARYPRAVEGIQRNHYVDDYLDSFESVDEAERVSRAVGAIHQKGGFHLRNWLSNSAEVLRGLNEEATNASKNLCLSTTDGDRVLGMLWQTTDDELRFSMNLKEEIQRVLNEDERPTKRQILKCLMGIFDPLGLLSVYLVHGKILLQDVWRAGLQWDERVPEEIFERWARWTALFPKIRDLRIPRCYFEEATEQTYKRLQLHVFVDASEVAFSAVAYFRVIDIEGKAECSLVAARTKVAPLKPLSIPRLELQAAVLGSRLMSFVQENHSVKVKQRFLWSDSATVLAWLRADHRRYKQYVACRVGELLSTTDVAEWRWVPSKSNPADAATKWGKNSCPKECDEWFKGPKFLRLSEDNWPEQVKTSTAPEEELRPCLVIQGATIPECVVDFARFSRWRRLLGAVAYVHRFIDNCQRRRRNEKPELLHLSQDELRKAKSTIIRMVQWQEFPAEMASLTRGQTELPKTSRLYQTTPTMDEHGVLRVDGRIGAAPHAAFDARFPAILPRKHHVTKLVVHDFHRACRHGNSETVVNEVRQYYNISRLRTVVKQVAAACQWCKVAKANPKVPRMAPLPVARLSSFCRPFTYTGIDFFGPFLVKVGRSAAKRWICLSTCLTTRAVHVEVAHSLSTPSCVKCIRRFVCRRGAPAEIYTDNGTNFQGAKRLLQEEIENELAATFTNEDTKWNFIPPGAPHMGGAWERMVRSVKSAMEAAYKNDRKLDDEGLETLVVEAEGIVNSRPLTYLPLDAAEGEALTPNHFLLGSSKGVRQPAVNISDPAYAVKSSWNLIQHQLDIFWKRWVQEYLPMLTKRMKWFGEVTPVAVGDLVLVVDDTRRNGWLRGRVKEVATAEDGRVRQAVVQTARGLLRRPVSKLAVLEVEPDGKTGTGDQCYGGEDVTASTASQCGHGLTMRTQPL